MPDPRVRASILAATFGFALTVYFYAPGFMTWDSSHQYNQVLTGQVENPHPPIMVYLWWLTDSVLPGPAGMLLVHAAAFWLGLALLAIELGRGPGSCIAIVLATGLFLPSFGLIGIIWKDIGMCAFLLLGAGAGLRGRRTDSLVWTGLAIVALFYAIAVRSNAILIAAPIVLWLFAPKIIRSLRGWVPAFAILVGLGLAAIATTQIGVTRIPYRAAVPLWDLAVMSLDVGEMLIPREALPSDRYSLIDLRRATNRLRCNFRRVHDAERVGYLTLDDEAAAAVMLAWGRTIFRYPEAYLRHRIRVTRAVFDDPSGKVLHVQMSSPKFENPFQFNARPGYPLLRRALLLLTGTWLYRPWSYVLAATLLLAISAGIRGPRSVAARVFLVSGLLAVAPLPVIAPSADFRYALWLILTTLLGALLLGLQAFSGFHGDSRQ